jgi:hypothetical protein
MAFMFKLEDEDGEPADLLTFKASVSDWKAGDPIYLS